MGTPNLGLPAELLAQAQAQIGSPPPDDEYASHDYESEDDQSDADQHFSGAESDVPSPITTESVPSPGFQHDIPKIASLFGPTPSSQDVTVKSDAGASPSPGFHQVTTNVDVGYSPRTGSQDDTDMIDAETSASPASQHVTVNGDTGSSPRPSSQDDTARIDADASPSPTPQPITANVELGTGPSADSQHNTANSDAGSGPDLEMTEPEQPPGRYTTEPPTSEPAEGRNSQSSDQTVGPIENTQAREETEVPVDHNGSAAEDTPTNELARSTSTSPPLIHGHDGDMEMVDATAAAEEVMISRATPSILMRGNSLAFRPPTPFGAGTSSLNTYDSAHFNGSGGLDLGTSSLTPRKPTAGLSSRERFQRIQRAAKEKAMNRNLSSRAQPSTPARKPYRVNLSVQPFDDDDDDYFALQEYEKAKKKYEGIRRNRDLSVIEEIAWHKIQTAETARQRKRQADRLRDQEEGTDAPSVDDQSLFIPNYGNGEEDDDEEMFSDHEQLSFTNKGDDEDTDSMDWMHNDPGEGSSASQRRKASVPRKTPKPSTPLKGAAQSMFVGYEAFENDGPKKKRKMAEAAAAAAALTKGKGKEKGKAKNSSAKKGKSTAKVTAKVTKKAKFARYAGPSMTDIGSLFTSNVFKDQEGNQDRPDQPTFDKGTRKDDALKQLIASVPLEHQKSARADKNVLLAATKDFVGRGSCKPDIDGKWRVKGMRTSLKGYQLLGSAFMRRREAGLEEPRGGLVADQMGLGKTVMMLANIINGRPPKEKKDGRATLIVACPALVQQWKEEIQLHCEEKAAGAIMVYRSNRLESTRDMEIMEAHDIILTTYTEVMKSYPKMEPPIEMTELPDKQAWWKNEYETKRGPLHRMRFLRVVLDEAQAIKNHTGRTSIACRGLIADHKWALSGTPVLNGITELYPYFKFLGVPYTGSFKIFKANYCNRTDSDHTQRLLVRLNQFMIRRTHRDIMFGAPILKLPKATPITHWCEFNDIERSVYDIVKRRFVARINGFAQQGLLEKSYTNIFVMLLRLRQLTGHILTLQLTMQDLLEREDIETLKQLTAAEKASDTSDRGRQIVSICTQLAAMIKKTRDSPSQNDDPVRRAPVRSNTRGSSSLEIDEDLEELDDLEDETFNSDANLTTGQQFGMKYDFDQYLGTLMDGKQWEAVKAKAKCSKCRQTPNIPWLTACRHIYCQACLEELQLKAATDGKERAICCHCASMFSYSMPCEDEDDDGSQNEPLDISDDDYSNRRKGKEKKSAKRARTDRETIRDDWIDMPGTVLPSAKTLAIKAQILNWLHEAPDTKIIIYTQFLAMIRILARICQHECWSYCEYHGSMSLMARTNTIKTFAEDPSKKVLLASLKCGGLGLNLTMASRVIVVDPWWNHAIEQQAFCRVFRYGQVAQTYMTRFCVRNTVDEKLINMQERKTAEIDEVMEDNGKTMKKLSMGDLLRLFGPVREMDDGTPFIMPDEEEATGCVDPEYGDEDE